MNTFSVLVLLSAIYVASATDACSGRCASGYSCQVIFTAKMLDRLYKYYECVQDGKVLAPQELLSSDNDPSENFRRYIIRSCTPETVAADCGKERCCLGGKFCSPYLFKYAPCNLKNVHKCECREGLTCKSTYDLKIPFIGITLNIKQCMEPENNDEVKEGEMIE